MNVCIDVQNVSFTYEDAPEPALHHVSLQVHEGEFLAVLGHNGSGKSTLAKLLNALYLPTEGHITVCGMDTQSDEDLWKIRQKAGMISRIPIISLSRPSFGRMSRLGWRTLAFPAKR